MSHFRVLSFGLIFLLACGSGFSLEKVADFSLAPYAIGPNLAREAVVTADSVWWEAAAWEGFSPEPICAVNGNPRDFWTSRFGSRLHWISLEWKNPVIISRVFVTHINAYAHLQQTIAKVSVNDVDQRGILTLPGFPRTYGGASQAPGIDIVFPPMKTNRLTLYLHTGPVMAHPNLAVFISEIEVFGPPAS